MKNIEFLKKICMMNRIGFVDEGDYVWLLDKDTKPVGSPYTGYDGISLWVERDGCYVHPTFIPNKLRYVKMSDEHMATACIKALPIDAESISEKNRDRAEEFLHLLKTAPDGVLRDFIAWASSPDKERSPSLDEAMDWLGSVQL